MKTIGEKIRELRKKRKISQEELSFELNVSRQTVHKWENNIMLPNAENIKSLCSFFNVNADYFLNEDSVDDTVQKDIAIAESKAIYISKIKIILIALCALIFVLFTISFFFAICSGLAVFSDNIGYDNVASVSLDSTLFASFLILSIILLALDICLAVYVIKK